MRVFPFLLYYLSPFKGINPICSNWAIFDPTSFLFDNSVFEPYTNAPTPLHDIQATVHFGHETGATVPSSFARPAPPTRQILFDLIVFDDQGKVSLACAFSAVYCTTRPNNLRLIWESAAVCQERFSTLHNFHPFTVQVLTPHKSDLIQHTNTFFAQTSFLASFPLSITPGSQSSILPFGPAALSRKEDFQ